MTRRIILFFGAPGSGKGTQSAWLSTQLGIASLSTGEMLRNQAKQDTPEGRRLKEILANGSLVSDSTVCEVVAARLSRGVPKSGLILDGFPRTLAQAKCLDDLVGKLGLDEPLVLHLDAEPQRLIERLTARRQCPTCRTIYNLRSLPSRGGLQCEMDGTDLVQRDDDREDVIRRRFTEFESSCGPVIEHYRDRDYYRIPCAGRPDEIASQLLRVVVGESRQVAA